ncbi:MAG: ATP-NAD kinase family protein [Chloroflexi bacterium]|nr:ATP-NAD kinase family protein [Chloroflexota bacterium]
MRKLGLIVNPIAGLGGAVGLKGTDGNSTYRKALEMGAIPRAAPRAVEALRGLGRLDGLEVLTYPGSMGENEARQAGLSPTVIGSIDVEDTSAEDTRLAAKELSDHSVDLILFAGGDGTARDLCSAVGDGVPSLGIPAGVKMYSGVYATTPRAAGRAAAQFLAGELPHTRLGEVMDIDEEAFREGEVQAQLYGYLRIPDDTSHVQVTKSPSHADENEAILAIAGEIVDSMREDTLYILGPGTTTKGIADVLRIPKTLLGVDAVLNGALVASDVTESQLIKMLDGGQPARVVVTAIGGQGHIFGRGNQQISADVLRRVGMDNIIVVATRRKLGSLSRRPLMVDTGSREIDRELSGYIMVTTGRAESAMVKVSD